MVLFNVVCACVDSFLCLIFSLVLFYTWLFLFSCNTTFYTFTREKKERKNINKQKLEPNNPQITAWAKCAGVVVDFYAFLFVWKTSNFTFFVLCCQKKIIQPHTAYNLTLKVKLVRKRCIFFLHFATQVTRFYSPI